MSATGKAAASQRGFTLLELLVAIAITGLLAGIGFPALSRMLARQHADEAKSTVLMMLVRARAAALASDRTVTVGWSPSARAIVSDALPPAAVPGNVALSWPPRGIGFFPDGSTTGGEVAMATGGGPLRVTVDSLTGRIRAAQ